VKIRGWGRANNGWGGRTGPRYLPGEFTEYPNSVLEFPVGELGLHPTAKPVRLLEFLIETYPLPGEIVLDSTRGVGGTGPPLLKVSLRLHFECFETPVSLIVNVQRVRTGGAIATSWPAASPCIPRSLSLACPLAATD
jgi:hypothetical protein